MPFRSNDDESVLIDRHIGARISLRRDGRGVSQSELGAAAGLTAQQLEKLERGVTRVSASALFAIARALASPVSYFFEGLPAPAGQVADDPVSGETDAEVSAFLATPDGRSLVAAFSGIERDRVRKGCLAFLRRLDERAEGRDKALSE
jgi:transcriptional regulator with XRE-family HTH domain